LSAGFRPDPTGQLSTLRLSWINGRGESEEGWERRNERDGTKSKIGGREVE